MIEAGVVFRDLTLENPIRAIREISHDITGPRRVKLANGREATALEIQREYHQKAADFVDRRGGDPVSKRVLELWGRTLDADRHRRPVADRPRDRLGHQVPADRALPGQARPAAVLAPGRPARPRLPRHPPRPRAVLPAASGRARSTGSPPTWRSSRRKNVPPQTTRARLRGEFIRRAQEKRRDFTVDWVHLKLNDQAQRTVLCKDPFRCATSGWRSSSPRCERVAASAAAAGSAREPVTGQCRPARTVDTSAALDRHGCAGH